MSDRNNEDKLNERWAEITKSKQDSAEAEQTAPDADAHTADIQAADADNEREADGLPIAEPETAESETAEQETAGPDAAEMEQLERQQADQALAGEPERHKPTEGGASIGRWLWPAATVALAIALIVTFVWNKPGTGQSEVVAEATGVTVTQQELLDELVRQMGPAQVGNIVDTLITTRLVELEADKSGYTVNDAQVEEELNGIKANFPSDEAFEQALAQNYLTLDGLTEQIVMQLRLEHIFAEKIATDETTLRQYYTDNESSFGTPEQVRASHILLASQEEAEEVLAELNGGADFATLAGEKSLDPGSGSAGGDLNFFPRGVMHAEFEEAAFALQPGDMSGVVQSPSGYHIILATDRQQAELKSFEELEEEVRDRYMSEQMYALVPAWIEETKQAADIKNPYKAE